MRSVQGQLLQKGWDENEGMRFRAVLVQGKNTGRAASINLGVARRAIEAQRRLMKSTMWTQTMNGGFGGHFASRVHDENPTPTRDPKPPPPHTKKSHFLSWQSHLLKQQFSASTTTESHRKSNCNWSLSCTQKILKVEICNCNLCVYFSTHNFQVRCSRRDFLGISWPRPPSRKISTSKTKRSLFLLSK